MFNPFKLFKLITKSGRASLLREVLDEYVTRERAADIIIKGVCAAYEGRIPDEEHARGISSGLAVLSRISQGISRAVDPEGDEGVYISLNEKVVLAEEVEQALAHILPDDTLAKVREAIVKKVVG